MSNGRNMGETIKTRKGKLAERCKHDPQSNDKNVRSQNRPKSQNRDRDRPTYNPPKSTNVTKTPNTKNKQPKQLTFSVDAKINTNFVQNEDESDEDDVDMASTSTPTLKKPMKSQTSGKH